MSVKINGRLGDCDFVAQGTVLRLFNSGCSGLLKSPAPGKSLKYSFCPKERDKAIVTAIEREQKVILCGPVSFMKKSFMLRMKVKRYDPGENFTLFFESRYVEAFSANFETRSESYLYEQNLNSSVTRITITAETPSIGDPYGAGSKGIGVTITDIVFVYPEDDVCGVIGVLVTATLITFGISYDHLVGQTVVQNDSSTFSENTPFLGFGFGWTGLTTGPLDPQLNITNLLQIRNNNP